MSTIELLQNSLENKVVQNKDISHFLTLKTKTKAEFYITAETKDDIVKAVRAAIYAKIPFFILGGGSNLAILKDQIPGLVIHNRYLKKEILSEDDTTVDLLLSSGYPMSLVVKETIAMGLSGFEYHLGLPGTIGGAIYMNSKWTKPLAYCGDSLAYAIILNQQQEERKVDRDYFKFAYDFSILQHTKEIVLEAVFRLKKEDKKVLQERADTALAYRKETQPVGVATGGCFFQNISEDQKEKAHVPTTSAGYLIDKAGLKGKQVGSYVVSDKHANFIINTGEGKPADLHKLLDIIKATIKEKFGVELEEEVRII